MALQDDIKEEQAVDKRALVQAQLEAKLFRDTLVNLLLSLDRAPSAPKLDHAIAAARQVLAVHQP